MSWVTSSHMAVLLLLLTTQPKRIVSQIVECYTDGRCSTSAGPFITSTTRECCVDNPDGTNFRFEGDELCYTCIVFGFFQDTLTAPEQGPGYSVQAGYLKGASEAQRNLVFNVQTEQGTATSSDFTLNTPSFRVLFRNSEPEEVSFTFRVDAVAQEPSETAVLRLESLQDLNTLFNFNNNAFFLDQLSLTIIDSDRVEIIFTEDDFRRSEPGLFMPVRVSKDIRIATPITVEVIPLTLTQFRNIIGRPDPPGLAEDDPLSPIEANLDDFNNSVITVTFPPDEGQQLITDLPAFVPIVDDPINEANEQDFIVTLRIVGATNSSSIDITERQDAICRIIDDDDIRIGFESPTYTLSEPEFAEERILNEVFLAKENGVISEQSHQVVVTSSATTPPNTNIQPAGISEFIRFPNGTMSLINNDFSLTMPQDQQRVLVTFPAHLQRIPFNFVLYPDNVAEGIEAFQLSSASLFQRNPPFLEPVSKLSRVTFILVIEDNDHGIAITTEPPSSSLSTSTQSMDPDIVTTVTVGSTTNPPQTPPLLSTSLSPDAGITTATTTQRPTNIPSNSSPDTTESNQTESPISLSTLLSPNTDVGATMTTKSSHPTESTPFFPAIIGGVVGGLVIAILIVLIVIVVISVLRLKHSNKQTDKFKVDHFYDYPDAKIKETNPTHHVLPSHPPVTTIELNPAYQVHQKDSEPQTTTFKDPGYDYVGTQDQVRDQSALSIVPNPAYHTGDSVFI